MRFKEYLNEAFAVIGDFIGRTISKSYHCDEPRPGTNVPRDGGMSKSKYKRIIDSAIEKGMDFSSKKENHIIWKQKGYNGMVISYPGTDTKIKTVIVQNKPKASDLFKKAEFVYNIEDKF